MDAPCFELRVSYYLWIMFATHSSMAFLAELTVQMIGGWLAAVFVGGGVLWVLFLLMVRGFWDKNGKPAVKELIVALHAEPEAVRKRQEEMQSFLQTWHNAPEQIEARTKLVKAVIDNEVHRDDGVIHKDITSKVMALEVEIGKKVDTLANKFDRFQEGQERRDKENREFSTQVLAKLARMEGALQTITNRKLSSDSSADLPAQRPTKSSGHTSEGR